MFRSLEIARTLGVAPPAKPDQIVSYMLARELDFEPGQRYAYSNFGYCLLGRVIEQVTHSDYESWVRQQVLEPMGIGRMRIGGTLLSQRLEGEVQYYSPGERMGPAVVGPQLGRRVPRPYGTWFWRRWTAHGGWLASAIDMAQFAAQVQSWQRTKVLSADMYRALIACPPGLAGHDPEGREKSSYYGLGWDIRPLQDGYNLWHMGALSGTSTLLVLRHDGLCWAVLFNSSYASDRSRPAAKIDALVHQAAAAVEQWPDCD